MVSPSLKTTGAASIDLRKNPSTPCIIPLSAIKIAPAYQSAAKPEVKPLNIREAIRLNDHARIRNGSPGTKSGERTQL